MSVTTEVALDAQDERLLRKVAAAARLFNSRPDDVRGRLLRDLLPDQEDDYELGLVPRVTDTKKPDGADDTDLLVPEKGLITVNLN